jgi:hypothetical protein
VISSKWFVFWEIEEWEEEEARRKAKNLRARW